MTRTLSLTQYTERQREQFLRLISEGIIRKIACESIGIPPVVIQQWVRDDEDFAERYKLAREQQAHAWGDEIIEIADAPCSTIEQVQHAKLRVEARKWLMGKNAPRHYGERVQNDHTHMVGVVLLPALDTDQKALKDISKRLPGSDAGREG
jgi:hypothetical protein